MGIIFAVIDKLDIKKKHVVVSPASTMIKCYNYIIYVDHQLATEQRVKFISVLLIIGGFLLMISLMLLIDIDMA